MPDHQPATTSPKSREIHDMLEFGSVDSCCIQDNKIRGKSVKGNAAESYSRSD